MDNRRMKFKTDEEILKEYLMDNFYGCLFTDESIKFIENTYSFLTYKFKIRCNEFLYSILSIFGKAIK